MGTWGTSIKDSDAFADVYSDFFELYNDGGNPENISRAIIEKNSEMLHIEEEKHDFWFALALAQWETKSLEPEILLIVEAIVGSGDNIKIWEELGASDQDLKKRKIALNKFLEKIKSNRSKAKARRKPKNKKPIFSTGDCLVFKMENGNYGGAIIIATDSNPETAYNLVATTRINKKVKPNLKDFETAKVLVLNFANWQNKPDVVWCAPDLYLKEYSDIFECIGNIRVEKKYDVSVYSGKDYPFQPSYTAGWKMKYNAERQFESELTNPKPSLKLTVKELVMEKKWWNPLSGL